MDDEDLEERGFGTSDWLKAIGGLLFFIAGLLPWWSYSFESPAGSLHYDDNAFDFLAGGVVPYLIFVAIAVVTIVSQTGSLHLPAAFVHPLPLLVLATIGSGLVAYSFFDDPGDNASRGLGLYLAVAGAVLVLAGCVIAYRDERLAAHDEQYFDAADGLHPPLP
jgi:hypothetical protein